MRKFLCFTFFLTLLGAVAARAVDYQALEVEMSQNPAEYREMLDRFIKGDTTLTPAQVAKVYYGFALTPSYEPTDSFPEIRKAFAEENYALVDSLLPEALALNPVSLTLLNIGQRTYEKGVGSTPGANALNMAIRFDILAQAILDSGRGTLSQSPFYVISSDDLRSILKDVIMIGPVLGTDTVGDIDAVKFSFPGKNRIHILYFDNTIEKKFLNERKH